MDVDSPADAKLNELAVEYLDAREEEANWKHNRKCAKDAIIERMKKKNVNVRVFRSGDLVIVRSETDNLKVDRVAKKDA